MISSKECENSLQKLANKIVKESNRSEPELNKIKKEMMVTFSRTGMPKCKIQISGKKLRQMQIWQH